VFSIARNWYGGCNDQVQTKWRAIRGALEMKLSAREFS
jgi:hypothetical protein